MTVQLSLAPSWSKPISAMCWREVLQVALDGWRPAEFGVEILIDRVEGVR